MAAPQFRAVMHATRNPNSSIWEAGFNTNGLVGLQEGDLMILAVWHQLGSWWGWGFGGFYPWPWWDDGRWTDMRKWTPFSHSTNFGYTGLQLFYKFADASDVAGHDYVFPGFIALPYGNHLTVLAYSGCDKFTPINESVTNFYRDFFYPYGYMNTMPGSTTVDDCLILDFAGMLWDPDTLVPPAGSTIRTAVSGPGGRGPHFAVAESNAAVAGAIATPQWQVSRPGSDPQYQQYGYYDSIRIALMPDQQDGVSLVGVTYADYNFNPLGAHSAQVPAGTKAGDILFCAGHQNQWLGDIGWGWFPYANWGSNDKAFWWKEAGDNEQAPGAHSVMAVRGLQLPEKAFGQSGGFGDHWFANNDGFWGGWPWSPGSPNLSPDRAGYIYLGFTVSPWPAFGVMHACALGNWAGGFPFWGVQWFARKNVPTPTGRAYTGWWWGLEFNVYSAAACFEPGGGPKIRMVV